MGILNRLGLRQAKDWENELLSGTITLEAVCGYLGLAVPDDLVSIKDIKVPCISASTRTTVPGSIYFANGTKQNYQSNVLSAFSRGALCAVTKYPVNDEKGDRLPCLVYGDPMGAAAGIAALIKNRIHAKTIAITGSVGKTSTKEMIRLVASCAGETVYSKSNQNGFGQVVRYAQSLDQGVEVYIQEAGLSRPGSVARAARVLRPDAFVVTNIGWNHVGYFDGKQEGILLEKLSLDRYAAEKGVGFINWDDDLLRGASYKHAVVSYSVSRQDADYHASDIVERNGKITFDIIEKATQRRIPIVLNIVGRHNVGNAVCAYAIGRWLGIEEDEIIQALASFSATGVRQNLVYIAGQHVYLDCYNASEDAIGSVVDTMATIDVPEHAKRILVLADIDDKLGVRTEEVHRRVGKMLASHREIGLVLCLGKHAAWIAEEAANLGIEVLSTEDRTQLESWIVESMDPDDLIAFKGGQQMLLPKTVDNLFGTPFFMLDGDMVDKYSTPVELDGYRFRILEDYGVEVRGFGRDTVGEIVDLPDSVQGVDVRLIGASAFSRTKVSKVMLPASVRTINRAAFYRAASLRSVSLSCGLEYIGPSAFNTCASLKSVVIPEGVTTIGHRAFAYCRRLEEVVIPSSVKTIEPEAFFMSPKAKLICPRDSYAYKHCKREYPEATVEP